VSLNIVAVAEETSGLFFVDGTLLFVIVDAIGVAQFIQ
jgi:hypothetical protein